MVTIAIFYEVSIRVDHNKIIYFFVGAVMLSPSPRALVCNAGDSLEVTCNTTESTLQWRLTLMGMRDPIETISISSTTVYIPRVMINTSRVSITRTSGRGEAPLISTLEISSVNEDLNGTLNVTCMEIGTLAQATTTIYFAGNYCCLRLLYLKLFSIN